MRCRWPKDCPFVLNGEVDKAAHPTLMELGAGGYKPDLLCTALATWTVTTPSWK